MVSQSVVIPVKTGIQDGFNLLIFQDSGACPRRDPGFAGMTGQGIF